MDKDLDPVDLVKKAESAIEGIQASQKLLEDQLKESKDASDGEISAMKDGMEKLAEDISGFAAQLIELEQAQAENVRTGKVDIETLGHMVINSDAYKEYAAGNSMKMRIQANTIIGQEGSPLENADTLVAPQRLSGIIPGAFRLLRIEDILPSGRTTSNAIEYPRELSFTNAAAETNEGVSKPESTLTFELVTANVKTIPTFLKASKQIIEDAPMLESYIDTRLRHAVNQRADTQLLNGNGTNPNISGLTDSGNHTAFTATTGENGLDSINRMIEAIETADYVPTAILMNPADWRALERIKVNAGTDDRYIIGNPTGVLGPMLWGLPIVLSNAVSSGNAMVAQWDVCAQVFNRQDTVVEIFEQDEDNVQKNLYTIRAERRLALAIYVPAAIQYGGLTL